MKSITQAPTPETPSFDESGTSTKASTAGATMIVVGAVVAFLLTVAGAVCSR